MSNITIYHNPRCSKSRQTLQLLKDNGIDPTINEYLKGGLTVDGLEKLLGALAIEPRQMMRIKETEYKEQNLAQATTTQELLAAIVATPKLLERPIVVNGDKAAIGRPPESVLDIL